MTTKITKSQLKEMIKEALVTEQMSGAWESTDLSRWIDFYENFREAARTYSYSGAPYSNDFPPELVEQITELDSRLEPLLKEYDRVFKKAVVVWKKRRTHTQNRK